jgi:hypothetical protein
MGDRYVATSLPSEIPAPVTAALPALRVGTLSFPGDEPLPRAMDRFFQAFLAGQGEVDRYTAPGSGIRAIRPAPFSSVSLDRVGLLSTDETRTAYLAQANVRATDPDGYIQILTYALELHRRAGLWEVTEVLPAPPVAEEGS